MPEVKNENQNNRLTVRARRHAMQMAYWNGFVWSLGNGLASTTLVVYLAIELGVPRIGLGIGLILAAPSLAGVLRLAAPALMGWVADRKRFCIAAYLSSAVVLVGLPVMAVPGVLDSRGSALTAMIVLWCVYHLLEYLGTIALWSWIADVVPLRIRGRFIGIRQRWMVLGISAAMICGGLFAWGWKETQPDRLHWLAYAIPAALGAMFMAGAVVPLCYMPGVATERTIRGRTTWRSMLAPFADANFLRLLAFGCWFSFSTGITQSAQNVYPMKVLEFSLFAMLAMRTWMRLGQFGTSPQIGKLADRFGNRPVLIVSLLVTAAAPLFFLLAGHVGKWWLLGAWTTWIAYAGMNVCLPNLMLKLSPRESKSPYIAAYFATTGLCYAVSVFAGGWIMDESLARFGSAYYDYCFVLGWILRSAAVLLLLTVVERQR